jgi:putative ABC transport system permease protein
MLALTAALGFVAAGCSAGGDALRLEEDRHRPSATTPIGTATLVLFDPARRDPFAADRRRRRILAEVYYPAVGSGERARYLPLRVAEALSDHRVPARVLASVRTNAKIRAPARPGRYPVLVFSPGYTVPHDLYTAGLEDLASRGYVVAVDHNYETEAVQFPNGEVVRRKLPANPRNTLDAIEARVDDVALVLEMLPSLKRRPPLAGADTSRLALLGHSLGGLTAATVAARNSSVACAADVAGSV